MKVEARGHEQEDVRRLREFTAFNKLSDDQLVRLVRAAEHISTPRPWPLIHEQTPSDSCFILLSGEAGVYVGQDRIAVIGPGEVIGESALRRGKLRSATVTSLGPVEVLRIERDAFAHLLDEMPALREIIDSTAARHAPVEVPAKPKPSWAKVNASIPADLAERFEEAAHSAGVSAAAALEDAITQWIERNGKAEPSGQR